MKEPVLIDTTVFRDETGAEVCWKVGGCRNEPFCHRRNLEGEIIEVCGSPAYQRDWLIPGGIQEYCSAKDAPLTATEWSKEWGKK